MFWCPSKRRHLLDDCNRRNGRERVRFVQPLPTCGRSEWHLTIHDQRHLGQLVLLLKALRVEQMIAEGIEKPQGLPHCVERPAGGQVELPFPLPWVAMPLDN